MQGKLKQADIDSLPTGYHGDGGGLYLMVSGPSARSWLYRYRLHGKSRWHGLGGAKDISLAQARKLRDAVRFKVKHDKIDVVRLGQQEREAARIASVTFRQAAEQFIAGQEAHWKSVEEGQTWRSSLATYAYPTLGDMTVGAITRQDVLKVLEPIWLKKAETAKRLRGRIENILNWSIARGYRSEEIANAADRQMLKHGLPAQPKKNGDHHHAALPYKSIPDFMKALRQREGVAPLALEFAILTASRISEVLGARWDEIDRAEAAWTVPGERMKSGRKHRVPLTAEMLAVLDREAKLGQSELVFDVKRSTPLKLVGRMGFGNITVHGFRSTFSTWRAEETEFDKDLAEAALAHIVGDKVARGDLFGKRRALMQAWAQYCGSK